MTDSNRKRSPSPSVLTPAKKPKCINNRKRSSSPNHEASVKRPKCAGCIDERITGNIAENQLAHMGQNGCIPSYSPTPSPPIPDKPLAVEYVLFLLHQPNGCQSNEKVFVGCLDIRFRSKEDAAKYYNERRSRFSEIWPLEQITEASGWASEINSHGMQYVITRDYGIRATIPPF